jgi:ligand-binding sensor protein
MEVLALTVGGRDFGAKGGGVLCNKHRGHVIEKVVSSTWEKYHKYEKIEEVPVMSTTAVRKRRALVIICIQKEVAYRATSHLLGSLQPSQFPSP